MWWSDTQTAPLAKADVSGTWEATDKSGATLTFLDDGTVNARKVHADIVPPGLSSGSGIWVIHAGGLAADDQIELSFESASYSVPLFAWKSKRGVVLCNRPYGNRVCFLKNPRG